jgi:hypothetical protein
MPHFGFYKLTESTLSISRKLSGTEIAESLAQDGWILIADVAEYVAAIAVYFTGVDDDIVDEEGALVRNYLESIACLNINFPQRKHFEWAVEKLRQPPHFLKVAILHDKQQKDYSTSLVLWHLRHIVCAVIGVEGTCSDEELTRARDYLRMLERLLDDEYLDWSYDILDSPSEILAKLALPAEENDPHAEDSNDLETCLKELNDLVGLDGVKHEVTTLVNLMKVRRLRAARGMKMPEMSLHMVFSGNPGTGKTTVARLLGRIYQALGVLPRGHVIEVDRSGLVAGYVGQTALKTKEILQKAHGGILFIDEAYTLVGHHQNDFGQEAIDTVLKYMEDNRDRIVVIAAGYREEMKAFVRTNPGLQSRFNKFINFDDYSVQELYRKRHAARR